MLKALALEIIQKCEIKTAGLIVCYLYCESVFGNRKLSCDLATTKNLPKIILVGEDHNDEKSILMRSKLMKLGASGRLPVASEVAGQNFTKGGAFLPYYKSAAQKTYGGEFKGGKLHGIESPIPYAIIVAYKIRVINLLDGEKISNNALREIIDYSEELPLFAATIEKMKRRLGKYPQKTRQIIQQIASILDGHDILLMNASKKEKMLQDRIFDNFSEADVSDFLTHQHRELIGIVNQNYLDYFDKRSFPPINSKGDLEKVVSCRERGKKTFCNSKGRYSDLFIKYRDRDFSNNLGELLCNYAGKESHLVAIMGAAHSAGTNDLLENLSNGRVEIEIYKSYIEGDHKHIDEAVKKSYQLKYSPGANSTTIVPAEI